MLGAKMTGNTRNSLLLIRRKTHACALLLKRERENNKYSLKITPQNRLLHAPPFPLVGEQIEANFARDPSAGPSSPRSCGLVTLNLA